MGASWRGAGVGATRAASAALPDGPADARPHARPGRPPPPQSRTPPPPPRARRPATAPPHATCHGLRRRSIGTAIDQAHRRTTASSSSERQRRRRAASPLDQGDAPSQGRAPPPPPRARRPATAPPHAACHCLRRRSIGTAIDQAHGRTTASSSSESQRRGRALSTRPGRLGPAVQGTTRPPASRPGRGAAARRPLPFRQPLTVHSPFRSDSIVNYPYASLAPLAWNVDCALDSKGLSAFAGLHKISYRT